MTAPAALRQQSQPTHQEPLTGVRAPEERDWSNWVSATRTRNFLLRDPLLDWLDVYGPEKGFVRDHQIDGYDPRTDFGRFIMAKGLTFERAVIELLRRRCEVVTIGQTPEDSRDLGKAQQTLAAMKDGLEVIHCGVLHDDETRTYGMPDLLVRADVLERLFPNAYAFEREAQRTGNRNATERPSPAHHYRVVDIKFTTLHLLKSGALNNQKSAPAYKAQLFLYNRALGHAQGYEPPAAFLLGRSWEQCEERGSGCLDRLAPVSKDAMLSNDEPLSETVERAIDWIRRLRRFGSSWSVLPSPDVHELRPNMKNTSDAPWHAAKKSIANEHGELTQVWQIGVERRDTLVAGSSGAEPIARWDDPALTPELAGVKGPKTAPILQAVLDVNRDADGPPVRPCRITALEHEWRKPELLEFFVDFETVNDLDDDFSQLPARGGQPLIFMIGCGHVEGGRFVFRCFVADALTDRAEERILAQWFAHMAEVKERVEFIGSPRVFHWSPAEDSALDKAYNSAKRRHRDRAWPEPRWFDFLNQVVKVEPVVVRGALGFGLKAIGKALHKHGLISTHWEDGPTDGLGAMVGAWTAAAEAQRTGTSLRDVGLMREIERYNEVDCHVMYEVISWLRKNR